MNVYQHILNFSHKITIMLWRNVHFSFFDFFFILLPFLSFFFFLFSFILFPYFLFPNSDNIWWPKVPELRKYYNFEWRYEFLQINRWHIYCKMRIPRKVVTYRYLQYFLSSNMGICILQKTCSYLFVNAHAANQNCNISLFLIFPAIKYCRNWHFR